MFTRPFPCGDFSPPSTALRLLDTSSEARTGELKTVPLVAGRSARSHWSHLLSCAG